MIERLELAGDGLELTDEMKKYVTAKIGRLDRFLNRHARKTAHAEVILKEGKGKANNRFTAEVVLYLPHDTLMAKDSTLNIFAAIDIVEAKLKNQLKKYKEKSGTHTAPRRGILARLRRAAAEETQA